MSSKTSKAATILRTQGILVLAKKSFDYALSALHLKSAFYIPYCFIRVKTMGPTDDLGKLVDYALSGCGRIIKPRQVRSEILGLISLLRERKPKYVLEIGTAWGGTLFLLTRIAAQDAVIISLDLPAGKFGGGYSKWRIPLYKAFALKGQKMFLNRADSHEAASLQAVESILKGNKLDFLFIDGDHTYDGVKKDFEMYSPLVKEDGLVGFHDVAPHAKETGCEVERFWNEIKNGYEHYEFIEDMNQNMGGIGLIKFKKSI